LLDVAIGSFFWLAGGADVLLGVRVAGEGDFERGTGGQTLDVIQQLEDDVLVFSFPALGNVHL
jgi:hypothetical protein